MPVPVGSSSDLLPWVLVALAIITPGLALLEWIVGDKGVQRAKDRLVDWYIYIEDGDWSNFVASAAAITDAFLQRVLGPRIISARSFATWFLISVPFSIGAFSANHAFRDYGLATTSAGVATVFILDFAFLALGRFMLRILGHSTNFRSAIAFLTYAAIASYIGIGLFFAAGGYASIGSNWHIYLHGSVKEWLTLMLSWPREFQFYLSSPESSYYSVPGAILMVLPATLSTALFALVIAAAALIFLTRQRSHVLLALIVERLSTLPKGVFTAAALVATSLASIVTALDHVKSTPPAHDAVAPYSATQRGRDSIPPSP